MAVSGLSPKELTKEAPNIVLHVGLDLSRRRLDFDLLCEDGSRIERGAVPPDAGHMPKGFRDWTSAWEGYPTEAEEYRELDDERVLVLTRNSGRGKRSGIELSELQGHGAMVFDVRDGTVMRCVVYFDGDRALTDLGLEDG